MNINRQELDILEKGCDRFDFTVKFTLNGPRFSGFTVPLDIREKDMDAILVWVSNSLSIAGILSEVQLENGDYESVILEESEFNECFTTTSENPLWYEMGFNLGEMDLSELLSARDEILGTLNWHPEGLKIWMVAQKYYTGLGGLDLSTLKAEYKGKYVSLEDYAKTTITEFSQRQDVDLLFRIFIDKSAITCCIQDEFHFDPETGYVFSELTF